jgi:murein DD-endopeptidase MepM/ murein hydrolase activator NlpD
MRLLISLILLLSGTNLFAPKFFRQYELPWPIENPRVTQDFKGKDHDGLDMISFISKEVKVPQDCLVTKIVRNGIDTPKIICKSELFEYHFLHVSPLVKLNDEIKSGQLIAYYNNEGNSKGNHLHFVMINNFTRELLNPIIYLK